MRHERSVLRERKLPQASGRKHKSPTPEACVLESAKALVARSARAMEGLSGVNGCDVGINSLSGTGGLVCGLALPTHNETTVSTFK